MTAERATSACTRILDTAYELFSHNGLRAVGIERIIDESGVAKKTLNRHFPSKVDLILAFLDARGQHWTRDWLQRRYGNSPPRRASSCSPCSTASPSGSTVPTTRAAHPSARCSRFATGRTPVTERPCISSR